MRKILAGLTSAVAMLVLGSPANAVPSICDAVSGNLVQNCGFETGDLTDWTHSGSFLVVTNGNPNSGAENLDIGAIFPAEDVISQTLLTTTAGTSYTFEFYLNSIGTSPSGFTASWDGTTLFSLTDPPSSGGYVLHSFTVLGTGNDTLQFTGYDTSSFDNLDDIAVFANPVSTGVPEPLTLSLFGAGLAGIAALRRRKKAAA